MPWWRFLFWNAPAGSSGRPSSALVAYKFGEAAADAINKYGLYRRRSRSSSLLVIVFIGYQGLLEEANARKHER